MSVLFSVNAAKNEYVVNNCSFISFTFICSILNQDYNCPPIPLNFSINATIF